MEAGYPKSFGYNAHPSTSPMTLFGLKKQIMSAINRVSWVPYLGGGPLPQNLVTPPPPKKCKNLTVLVFSSPLTSNKPPAGNSDQNNGQSQQKLKCSILFL